MSPATAQDHELCERLATGAAALVAELRRTLMMQGASHFEIERQGDQAAHDWLMAELAVHCPGDAVLSEEGLDDLRRLQHSRTWIVDPLDGSSGFGWGSPEWAVHVALAVDGVGVAGALGFGDHDTLSSRSLSGSTVSSGRLGLSGAKLGDSPVVAVGRTRVGIDGNPIAKDLGGELLVCSSAGVKAGLVITGQADVYVHSSPLYEWDLCAPAVVAACAGFDVFDASGNELRFNTSAAVVPGIVISHPALTRRVLSQLR